jgi:hypothetical protein
MLLKCVITSAFPSNTTVGCLLRMLLCFFQMFVCFFRVVPRGRTYDSSGTAWHPNERAENRHLLLLLVHRCCDIKMPADVPLELVPMPYPASFPLITATIESMTAALHSSSLLAELSNDAPASFRRFAIDAVFGGPASRAGRDLLTFLGSIVFLQLNAPRK